jgi:ammonia channel protein AmtB
MTIRDEMRRKKRRLLIITWSGIALFILGILLSEKLGSTPLIPFVGFAVFCVSITLYGYWAMRCPHCKGNLGHFLYYGPPFSVSNKVKYCPFCGVDIDMELEEQNRVTG